MPPGPAPEPTALKVLKGNPGHRPLNSNEPHPRLVMPQRPGWLDPSARRVWDDTAPMLFDMGILTEADGETLAAYCQAVALLARATRQITRKGLTITTPTGQIRTAPWVHIQQRQSVIVRGLASELGLTPSARSRIEVPEEDMGDRELPGGIR